jgi:methyl-accepting chemotaxis protein
LISQIQSQIKNAVETMNDNTKQVESGAEAVKEALKSFEAIPALVEVVSNSLSEMSAVAEENAAGSEEVSSSVQEVSSAMQQVSGAAQQLSAGAEELKQLVSQFKLEEDKASSISQAEKREIHPSAKKTTPMKKAPSIDELKKEYDTMQKKKGN